VTREGLGYRTWVLRDVGWTCRETFANKESLQLQSRTEQGGTELGVSKCVLVLLRTPVNLPNNLLSNLGGINCARPTLALGVLHILGDVNLRSKKSGLDQEVSLEGGVHDSHGRGVTRQPNEMKGRINRGICEANTKWGVAGESFNGEFATGKVFSGSKEGDVAVDRAVRGFDEELGDIIIPFVIGRFLLRVIGEGYVDDNGRVAGLENQQFGGSEVSNDGVVLGPELTTVDTQSLQTLEVSQPSHVMTGKKTRTCALMGRNKVAASNSLILRSASSKR